MTKEMRCKRCNSSIGWIVIDDEEQCIAEEIYETSSIKNDDGEYFCVGCEEEL